VRELWGQTSAPQKERSFVRRALQSDPVPRGSLFIGADPLYPFKSGGGPASLRAEQATCLRAYVLVRRMGYRLKDVSGYLGRDAATIATMLSRMNERLAGDIQEKGEIERLGKIVDS
jgi:hypothetical protein